MTRTCVCFLIHYFSGEIRSRFEKLLHECAGVRDVYIIAERDTAVPAEHTHRCHFFDFAVLREKARSVIGEAIAPGNCHLRSLDFFAAFPDYEHYWMVEYDVFYDGDWRAFFSSFDDEPADLLAAHLRSLAHEPGWHWSATFDTGPDQIGMEARRIAFQPISRMSRSAMQALQRAVERGWVGHFEMLVPTAVEGAGLTLSEIGGNSAWTPTRRKQRHYLSAGNFRESPSLSTLRFRPPFMRAIPKLKNTLYHPLKGEPGSLRNAFLSLRHARYAVVGHPRRSFRYWAMTAARLITSRWTIMARADRR